MLFNIASTALVVLGTAAVSAAAPNNGQICQITSASNWCMMMPPMAGGDIAQNEDRAIAFCTNPDAKAPGAKIFPEGFIKSAIFASGNGYVQITGQIDRTKYSLSDNDQGGQYDIRAPVGSACAGYNHYVNLIEPHSNTYCIRCCKEKSDCNTGKSTYGCAFIVPGDYSDLKTDPAKPVVPTTIAAPVTESASASILVSASTTVLVPSSSTTGVATSAVTSVTSTSAGSKPTNGAISQGQSKVAVGVAAAAGAFALLAL
ncbi:hypothetical protein BGZ83_005977 [Gryganskiella cystojenkinii]|nr:hypothetical protein BGZ83_005977 [Gryganskiella cystojenkinii]